MKKQKDNFNLFLFFITFFLTILWQGYIIFNHLPFISGWDTFLSVTSFFLMPPIVAMGITLIVKEVKDAEQSL